MLHAYVAMNASVWLGVIKAHGMDAAVRKEHCAAISNLVVGYSANPATLGAAGVCEGKLSGTRQLTQSLLL